MKTMTDFTVYDLVNDTIESFARVSESYAKAQECLWNAPPHTPGYEGLCDKALWSWQTFQDGVLEGFMNRFPRLDETGVRILRRIMGGATLSEKDREDLTASLVAVAFDDGGRFVG